MTKDSEPAVEILPARLEFRHGRLAGTIYAHRIGGRIVEAYRGYGYHCTPIASLLRSECPTFTNR